MAERRLFVRPECKFRGLQPYMDGEESRDAGWRRAGLMAAAQRGDADAYGELLNEIGPVLMRFLRAQVRDAQEAEDLYQETLMAIHRARHGYDAARPFEPWLFAKARHIVAAHAERHRVRQAREVLVAAPPERPAESDGHLKPSSSRRFAASPASSARRSRSSGSRGFRSRRRPAAPGRRPEPSGCASTVPTRCFASSYDDSGPRGRRYGRAPSEGRGPVPQARDHRAYRDSTLWSLVAVELWRLEYHGAGATV